LVSNAKIAMIEVGSFFVEADLRKEDIKHMHKAKRRDAAFKSSHHKVHACAFP